ncbi:DUF3987 domain-containing protein [Dongia rigui]|uniref:DUF3987 domain-containing protein n=1 Tax=Dongia rigui TaxID=940149 RepID=A0ABU5DZE0_9PROT|nr:DUF3987 domain-containing protein [Dongia rigui]MDY0872649.1 DUF3987 domain-containing protein [Dongia rigui]
MNSRIDALDGTSPTALLLGPPSSPTVELLSALDEAQLAAFEHRGLGSPAAGWPYRDREGSLVGHVLRFQTAAGKTYRFASLNGDGSLTWTGRPKNIPLFRLAELLQDPSQGILVVEGEKTVIAAAEKFPAMAVTTSVGGSNGADKSDWSPVKDRDVWIWPDNDDAGRRYSADVARACRISGAKSIKIVNVPSTYPEGWDLADELPDGVTVHGLQQLQQAATEALSANGPLPLRRPVEESAPFPIHALGPILGPAAEAIHDVTQTPPAVAAQSVLGAASLCVQSFADVTPIVGGQSPTTLFLVTIAASGEGKSSSDSIAMRPIRNWEIEHERMGRLDDTRYQAMLAQWEADFNDALDGTGKGSKEQRAGSECDLEALRAKPVPPVKPYLLCSEPTIEGAFKLLTSNPGSAGLFSDEGGSFLGGFAMNKDNRTKTAAHLSGLWSSGSFMRTRAGEPLQTVRGVRFALHLMLQPSIADMLLGDPLLKSQGLMARMLISAPPSVAGTRMYRAPKAASPGAIETYERAMKELLSRIDLPAIGEPARLQFKNLTMSPQAKEIAIKFHDANEAQRAPGGAFDDILEFSARCTENAARIAAIIELVGNPDAMEVSGQSMQRSVELMEYYRAEALRLSGVMSVHPDIVLAERVRSAIENLGGTASLRDIYTHGHNRIRAKDLVVRGLSVLKDHGQVIELPGGGHWQIVK